MKPTMKKFHGNSSYDATCECNHRRINHSAVGDEPCTLAHCGCTSYEPRAPEQLPLPGFETFEGHGGHLGGPDDDHYSHLPVQPIQITEEMSEVWPRPVVYHLGEALAAILRVGSKGQDVRDLRKASWLLDRAADKLEGVG